MDEVSTAEAPTTSASNDDFSIEQLVSQGFVIFACFTEAVLFLFICFTNGTLLAAFVHKESLRTISNYYIIQMAVADFSVGLWMPMHIVMFLKPQVLGNMTLCTFRYASLLFSMSGSITSLLAMTYDRLSAILHPLHYQASMTSKRYVLSAVVVWLWPVSLAAVTMAYHNEWHELPVTDCELILVLKVEALRFYLLPFFFGISVAMIIMYVIILRVARQQALSEPPQVQEAGGQKKPTRMQKEMKLIKTGLIVFAAFYLCWLPMVTLILYQVSFTPVLLTPMVTALRAAATFPALLNSALNPLVYAFRMSVYRQHFYRMMPCTRHKVHPVTSQATAADTAVNAIS
ncbi:hypothetical protein CAPTEDRAFT_139399 [Capitella teleta]|uniref:G-protein coupled receptors family 1 profile domain-containing protein n=1 Tax=Capitella teleta TaxID=283909 RepID=R7TRH6_CAPTE|nr:hypothetical protein CAPTEDRAFT_139399 [Capitella teleta]|eukprot:ELT94101.1 hypothetical protein CAPTEDRAFT_139399 [Capitella teleta]